MFKKLILSTIFLTSNVYSVQVIGPSPRAMQAGQLGQALGQGLAIRMRENEIRNQKAIATRNYIYKLTMLRDYDPERHQEFVTCINQSALSYEDKLEMLFIFETTQKNHLKNKCE